jgi:hypothetical protein
MTTAAIIKKGEKLSLDMKHESEKLGLIMAKLLSLGEPIQALYDMGVVCLEEQKYETMLLSEESLAKDWNAKEEEEAWKNL